MRSSANLRSASHTISEFELSEAAALEVSSLDALFQQAGLVRSLRGSSAALIRSHRNRFDRAAQSELALALPEPRIAANGVRWLAVPTWQKISWLWHGFSTRLGGVSRVYCPEGAAGELNLGFTGDDDRNAVRRNRALMAEAITGDPATPLVALRQFHSNLLHIATAEDIHRERPWKADGVITDQPAILIGIQTADCIPVLVADRKRRVVGAFHAGWRGTVKRIVETGVGSMRLEFGCRPEDMVAAIGPGASACCYAVGEELLSAFESQFHYARELFREVYSVDAVRNKYPMLFLTQRAPGHSPIGPSLHLDLVEANRRQLRDAGLSSQAIHAVRGCTNCQTELFYSHRASHGHAGRMMAVIGINPGGKRPR